MEVEVVKVFLPDRLVEVHLLKYDPSSHPIPSNRFPDLPIVPEELAPCVPWPEPVPGAGGQGDDEEIKGGAAAHGQAQCRGLAGHDEAVPGEDGDERGVGGGQLRPPAGIAAHDLAVLPGQVAEAVEVARQREVA